MAHGISLELKSISRSETVGCLCQRSKEEIGDKICISVCECIENIRRCHGSSAAGSKIRSKIEEEDGSRLRN